MTRLFAIAVLSLAAADHLNYPPVPRFQADHWYVPHCFTAAMQWQEFLRSGRDVPLSAEYLTIKAAEYDGVSKRHGWSSPLLGWQLAYSFGAPPAEMCQSLMTKVTPEIDAAALEFCVGAEFKTWYDVPDYPTALAYLSEHPGAMVILTTYGRRGYAILGVDLEGRGLWFDPNHVGQPTVGPKSLADGAVLFDTMIYGGEPQYGPENFLVMLTAR